MRLTMKLLSLVLLAAGVVFAQDFEEIKTRTWTSRSGKTIEAELVSVKDGAVTLKSSAGKMFKIPISGLSAADQEFVKPAQTPAAPVQKEVSSGTVIEPKGSNRLPVLSNGTWKMKWLGRKKLEEGKEKNNTTHSIYRHEKFEARVDGGGNLYIFPVIDGEPSEGLLTIRHNVGMLKKDVEGERIPNKPGNPGRDTEHDKRRTRVKFTEYPQPSENPQSVTLKGIYEDDIEWECTYEFKDNTVTYWGGVVPQKGLEPQAGYYITCAFTPSHVFGPKVSLAQQRQETAHCSLEVKGGEKPDEKYDYTSAYNLFHPFRNTVVKGHFRPRIIKFEALDSDYLPIARGYNQVALYNGSSVWSYQEYDKSGKRYERYERTPKVKIVVE